MGIFKSVMGLSGVERVGDRILEELEDARNRGEQQLAVRYTQSEIGVRANATQMAALIRRKFEKKGFEVLDGEGGPFGADVRFIVGWSPPAIPVSRDLNAKPAHDPDLERFNRAIQAIDDAPQLGNEGAGMSGADIAEIRIWMKDQFDAGD